MSSTFAARVKAHMPVIFDYIGLVTCIALLVYSSETLASHRPSPIFSIVFSSLVLGHFLVPVARRTPILYGLLLVIGVVSTVFYALDIVHGECGYQVIVGRPRDIPAMPTPPHPYHWVKCTTVAGAFWLNLILTLYVDLIFAVSLLQRNSHGRIRLPDTDTEAGSTSA